MSATIKFFYLVILQTPYRRAHAGILENNNDMLCTKHNIHITEIRAAAVQDINLTIRVQRQISPVYQ